MFDADGNERCSAQFPILDGPACFIPGFVSRNLVGLICGFDDFRNFLYGRLPTFVSTSRLCSATFPLVAPSNPTPPTEPKTVCIVQIIGAVSGARVDTGQRVRETTKLFDNIVVRPVIFTFTF
jgi:hypothetical protein